MIGHRTARHTWPATITPMNARTQWRGDHVGKFIPEYLEKKLIIAGIAAAQADVGEELVD